jgi:hypothetical protein
MYTLTDRDVQRFLSKVVLGDNGCLEWAGGHFKQTGYATFNVKCEDGKWRPTVSHRVAFLLTYGYLPPEDTDHQCRNHGCVNPEHLESTTRQFNFLRGAHVTAMSVFMNRCPQGHEFTEENTYTRRSGKRECRKCMRRRDNQRSGTRQAHYRKMYQERKARQQAAN